MAVQYQSFNGREFRTISFTDEEETKMMLYWRMLRIAWTNHVSNLEVVKKIGTTRTLVDRIWKRELKFSETRQKECLENWTLTGHIDCKSVRDKQRVTYLMSLCRNETGRQKTTVFRSIKYMWKFMIVHIR